MNNFLNYIHEQCILKDQSVLLEALDNPEKKDFVFDSEVSNMFFDGSSNETSIAYKDEIKSFLQSIVDSLGLNYTNIDNNIEIPDGVKTMRVSFGRLRTVPKTVEEALSNDDFVESKNKYDMVRANCVKLETNGYNTDSLKSIAENLFNVCKMIFDNTSLGNEFSRSLVYARENEHGNPGIGVCYIIIKPMYLSANGITYGMNDDDE